MSDDYEIKIGELTDHVDELTKDKNILWDAVAEMNRLSYYEGTASKIHSIATKALEATK